MVVKAAYALINELERQFEVIRTDWVPDWNYPEGPVSFADGLTLEPNKGVPIRFAITDFAASGFVLENGATRR